MRRAEWTCCLLTLLSFRGASASPPPSKRFSLPAIAKIHIGKTETTSSPEAETCKTYTVTAHAVRHEFASYRLLTNEEKHYLYQVAPCFIQGSVTIRRNSFTWKDNPGGWLTTTYPDGVEKTLGTTDPAYLDTSR